MSKNGWRKVIFWILFVGITFGLSLFIRSVKHYPVWWWFMPNERKLCDSAPTNKASSPELHCYYIYRKYLKRYKIEQMNINPDLIIVRQFVIDKKEINWIIDYTREYSDPSPVYTLITDFQFEKNLMKALDFRTSNTFTVGPWESEVLYQRADEVTNLDVNNLDGHFDILWYRKYGHIIPHHDVYPYSDSVTEGRRFATMIVYLYEPEDGGATIFPNIAIAVKPNAGDAILWYNTKLNNDPDPLVAHAGCPVWRGEKMIGTFWFRAFHQEFRKPCPTSGERYSFS